MSIPSCLPIRLVSFCCCLVYTCIVITVVAADAISWSTTPFNTQSIPLHVKNPCNNIWAPQAFNPSPSYTAWPRLWDQNLDIKSWFAAVRVDGIAYELMGADFTLQQAVQMSVIVAPTRTSYLYSAGPVIVNMTFLSPIEPDDLVKMSSPFSYLYFTFTSNDTNVPHDVVVYTDITGEWITGDTAKEMTWSGSDDGSLVILQSSLVTPGPFQINNETCEDGTVYYAVQSDESVNWQIGPFPTLRANFENGTSLSNSASPPPLPVSPTFTILAISKDVGSVQSTTPPVVYTVGIVRDPVIQFTNQESLSPYYRVKYSNVNDLVGAVLQNFSDTVSAAEKLDSQLADAGGALSGNYSDLLAISTRQAFGAFDLTIPSPVSGKAVNATDVKAFARNFGNLGSGGMNAPDVIYAAMPAYIYLWPNLLGFLLEPLLEYQNSSAYTSPYAAQDIGSSYPNATGNNLAHNMQIEQTANMIIISLAHAQTTGDGSLLDRYYNLFRKWADFLVDNAFTPSSAETTSISDSISAANQTNLALKGIIGLGAMAKISNYTGQKSDSDHFQDIATQYAQEWTSLAVTSEFISLTYGSSGSGVIYNLYADKLLQTNLIDDSVFQLQTSYYGNETTKVPYGIPLSDSSSSFISRTDWTMFAAATVTEDTVRDQLISGIHSYASVSLPGMGNFPFTVVYDPSTSKELVNAGGGTDGGGINSFAQGAMFAPLALSVPLQTIKFSGSGSGSGQVGPDPNPKHKTNVGAIIGGTVGGVFLVVVIMSTSVYLRRRRRAEVDNHEVAVVPYNLVDTEPEALTRLEKGTNSNVDTNPEIRNDGSSSSYTAPVIYVSGKRMQHPPQMSQGGSLSSDSYLTPASETEEPTPILREVAELRREVQQMRIERHALMVAANAFESSSTEITLPPSYDSV